MKESETERSHDLAWYRITVKGCLDRSWSGCFLGLTVTPYRQRGETVLRGVLRDQTALLGLLTRLHDMNLPILRLVRRPAQGREGDAGR